MKLKVFSFSRVNSSNDTAIKLIKKGKTSGIVTVDKQLKGRGQYGKKWISNKGNLFISVFFQIDSNTNNEKFIRKNCSLVSLSIQKLIKKKTYIKPPNDILIDKGKVCGILQEIIMRDKIKYAIIGIGVNIIERPNLKGYKTTFINKFLNKKISKLVVFNKLKIQYEKKINKLKKCI